MSIKFLNGYWTIYSGAQPIISCESLWAALDAVGEISEVLS